MTPTQRLQVALDVLAWTSARCSSEAAMEHARRRVVEAAQEWRLAQ